MKNQFNYLGESYKNSERKIYKRIQELKSKKKKLEKQLNTGCNSEIIKQIQNLNQRLRPLLGMKRDTRETGREAENYYKRGWWRSERYTLNREKSASSTFTFRSILEEDIIDKLCPDQEDEESFI